MKSLVFSSFLILFVILALPQVNAQSESLEQVSQKSVEITRSGETEAGTAEEQPAEG